MAEMKTVSFRSVHIKRLAILAIAVLLILWVGWKWASKSRYQGRQASSMINVADEDIHEQHIGGMEQGGKHLLYKNRQFYLSGKAVTILSGAMHYFRIVPEYWKDRMLKLKACGLNTVETYVPWNLHEPSPGQFDFEGILDVRKYIQIAHELGLYVIFRPGPYICSEWDLGGLPSWLLADPKMKVRSNYKDYKDAAEKFFARLLGKVADLQYSRGGPIIAVQVENEYGSYSTDVKHLSFIKELLRKNGITEMLVTSDNLAGMDRASFSGEAVPMANFQKIKEGKLIFEKIKLLDPDFPLMVMEYWSGWFDHWGQDHEVRPVNEYAKNLKGILTNRASVNIYMFHGGTNFGFMAGANFFSDYKPDVTSYDYDAPLSEAGDITPKYKKTREIILEYVLKNQGITSLPDPPPDLPKAAYGTVKMENYIPWTDILSAVEETVDVDSPVFMEMLKLKNGYGQNYGFIVYQKKIGKGKEITLPEYVRDMAQAYVDSKEMGIVDWKIKNPVISIGNMKDSAVLDIVVENLGRVNYILTGSDMLNEQRKGISGDVYLDKTKLEGWKVYPLEFKKSYIETIVRSSLWKPFEMQFQTPGLYKGTLNVEGQPRDTFLLTKGWKKGVAFINGFNLGRFWNIGPQKTLYVPGPILKTGRNDVVIFDLHGSEVSVTFQSTPDLGSLA